MPRLARLDAPGVLHHVMGRGIEGSEIIEEYPAVPQAGFPLRSNKLQGIFLRKEFCLIFDSLANPAAPVTGFPPCWVVLWGRSPKGVAPSSQSEVGSLWRSLIRSNDSTELVEGGPNGARCCGSKGS